MPLRFGGGVHALKHRIRDQPTLEEQTLFIERGATLNARFWSGVCTTPLCVCPAFSLT